MTVSQRWTLTIIGFLTVGSCASVFTVSQIMRYGASRGAYEWLHGASTNGTQAHHESLLRRLEGMTWQLGQDLKVVAALNGERELEPVMEHAFPRDAVYDFWWSATRADGRTLGTGPACEGGGLKTSAGFGLCGSVAIVYGPSIAFEGAPWQLRVGLRLDEQYVDELSRLTGTEVTLQGPAGTLATTLQDLHSRRVPPVVPGVAVMAGQRAVGPVFGRFEVKVPSYRGYLLGTEPIDVGRSSMTEYVLASPIDSGDPAVPVTVAFMVPAVMMDIGANYAIAMQTGLTLVVLVVLALIAMRQARRMTRPLTALAAAAERVGNGEVEVTTPVEGDHELRKLATAFNTMTGRMAESRARTVQAEKLSAIGQLAGGVAHEINNPLGVILGFAQGMDRRVPEGDPLRLPVVSIVREAMRCRQLVQELLTFSRTARKTTETVDLNELVRSSALLVQARARTQQVEVQLDLDERVPALRANRTQVQQIIVNLGTNALDAMAEGGRLTLSTRRDGNAAALCVTDTGTGIPKDVLSRIFDPFFTTKDVGKGTGLGLSLVHEIVQQHHGHIRVDTEVGRGTAMTIELPIEQPPVARAV